MDTGTRVFTTGCLLALMFVVYMLCFGVSNPLEYGIMVAIELAIFAAICLVWRK